MDSVYVACYIYYVDDENLYNSIDHDIKVFKYESDAYKWIKKQLIKSILEINVLSCKNLKRDDLEKMTCFNLREDYLLGDHVFYKRDFIIEKKKIKNIKTIKM